MAWNEPGGNGKDPWGNRRNDGPPDLDEVFRKLQARLSGLFGGKRGGGDSGGGGGGDRGFTIGLVVVLVVFVLGWFIYGFYIVDEGERGVVLRFGRHVDTTLPGLHWHAPIVQSVETVNVSRIDSVEGTANVLTGDENIVLVNYEVQYRVTDAPAHVFNVRMPDLTLQQAAESAFREVIGKNTLDYVIQEGRFEVPTLVQTLLQETLDTYGTGHQIMNVNLIGAQPPQQVQAAFDDAIKAREDKDRIIQEAEVYANDIIPRARGDAQQRIERASAYKFRVVESAKGETQRFLRLMAEYEQAPQVTRDRLYLDAIEEVMAGSGKVLVDVEGGDNLMYLPLDKIIRNKGNVSVESSGASSGGGDNASGGSRSQDGPGGRNNLRTRGER